MVETLAKVRNVRKNAIRTDATVPIANVPVTVRMGRLPNLHRRANFFKTYTQ